MYKIKNILYKATKELRKNGFQSANLDVKILLSKALNKDETFFFSHPEAPLTNSQYEAFRRYIRRRKKGEPIAYILGHKEFYGLDFLVNKNVLIPRPESETLVEVGIKYLVSSIKQTPKYQIPNTKYQILDIGTGSGNIIISIAHSLCHSEAEGRRIQDTTLKFYATDISKKALRIAKKNAKRLLFENDSREQAAGNSIPHDKSGSNNIKFYHSDLFSNPRLPQKFDLIIANLPYVPVGIMNYELGIKKKTKNRNTYSTARNSIDFEPQNAIFADDNGTQIIKEFLNGAKERLNSKGAILLELDPRNSQELSAYAQKLFPQKNIRLAKDLAGLDRYLTICTLES